MNFIVNKKMNESYLESYLTSIMAPDTAAYGSLKVYTDLSANETISTGTYPFIMFAPESFLTIIETLNTANYNGTLSLGTVNFTVLINTLYSSDDISRNSAIDYLVTNTIITVGVADTVKALMSGFNNFNIADLNLSYVDTTIAGNEALNDVLEYSYANPIELVNHYDVVNNTNNEKLFLVILPLVNKAYGNTDGTYGDYVSTHTFKNGETSVEQSSFLAITLGDINDVTADIKYDHIDKIDYIDSFRLRFRLPKVLN